MHYQTKQDLKSLLKLLATPVLLVVLGLILLFSPDTASALVGKILGYGILLVGIASGVSAVMDKTGLVLKVILSLAFVILGGWLVRNPMALAEWIGRLVGSVLVVRGVLDLQDGIDWKHGLPMEIVTIVLGVILILLPRTTSRLVITLAGAAVLACGIFTGMRRLGLRKRLREPDESNIIDAL